MFTAEVRFKLSNETHKDEVVDTIDVLLSAMRMGGRIAGREFPMAETGETIVAYVMTPEQDALSEGLEGFYEKKQIERLRNFGVGGPTISIVGEDPSSAGVCECSNPGSYILITDFLSLESPVRCGECYSLVPLYRLPHTYDQEYYNVICWQSDYQACDTLQMGCRVGERWAMRQMSDLNSSLSKEGRDICTKIEQLTGVPTYYYLYRLVANSTKKREIARKCPGCSGEWVLTEQWHIFEFKCENCRLLSNISFSVDTMHDKLARLDKQEAACQNEP